MNSNEYSRVTLLDRKYDNFTDLMIDLVITQSSIGTNLLPNTHLDSSFELVIWTKKTIKKYKEHFQNADLEYLPFKKGWEIHYNSTSCTWVVITKKENTFALFVSVPSERARPGRGFYECFTKIFIPVRNWENNKISLPTPKWVQAEKVYKTVSPEIMLKFLERAYGYTGCHTFTTDTMMMGQDPYPKILYKGKRFILFPTPRYGNPEWISYSALCRRLAEIKRQERQNVLAQQNDSIPWSQRYTDDDE